MVCLEDFAEMTLPEGSCPFDYLVAVCERESSLFEKEQRNKKKECYTDDQYYLGGVDLDKNLITPSNLLILPRDTEYWEKKTSGKRSVRKQHPESGRVSSSKRIRYDLGGVDLDKNLITPSNRAIPEILILPKDTEEYWKKKTSGETSVRKQHPESGRASSNTIRYDHDGGEAKVEKNNSRKQKKGTRVPSIGLEPPPPGLPVEFRILINQLAGNRPVLTEKLVIQKELTKTDVSRTHNRLSIPVNLQREVFLTDEENRLLCQHNGKKVWSMDGVPLITPMMEVEKVSLRRWEMKKKSGVSSVSFVLTNTWNEIRRRNKFEGKMIVQLWAIRVDMHLWMALVRLS